MHDTPALMRRGSSCWPHLEERASMDYSAIRQSQQQLVTATGRELGNLLWWNLAGNRIEHQQLVNLAVKHGLPPRHVPSEIKAVNAFRRAIRHASSSLPDGLLLRPIGESTAEVIIGLVSEEPIASRRDIDFDVINRIVFDKAKEAVGYDTEHEAVALVLKLYRHHRACTTEDVRWMLTSFLGEAGVRLRQSGGTYFVPEQYRVTLEALCKVVEEAGDNETFLLPIADTAATKQTLRSVAQRTLDDEIHQLEAELAVFDERTVRQSTIERKLDGFEELRARVGLFSRVLSFRADALTARISSIQSSLRAKLVPSTNEAPPDALPPLAAADAVAF
jgi:hypothetical protein